VAALAAGRRYVGIDVDRAYLELTKKRVLELHL
jgi:DNA modification methylase